MKTTQRSYAISQTIKNADLTLSGEWTNRFIDKNTNKEYAAYLCKHDGELEHLTPEAEFIKSINIDGILFLIFEL